MNERLRLMLQQIPQGTRHFPCCRDGRVIPCFAGSTCILHPRPQSCDLRRWLKLILSHTEITGVVGGGLVSSLRWGVLAPFWLCWKFYWWAWPAEPFWIPCSTVSLPGAHRRPLYVDPLRAFLRFIDKQAYIHAYAYVESQIRPSA